jgi:hypothetical protein
MGYLTLVNINYITYILEGEKRYAHRQNDMDGYMVVGAEGGIEDIRKKVCILEETKHEQIEGDSHRHHQLAARLRKTAVHANAEHPSQQCGEYQEQYKSARSLIVEEQAEEEEVCVAGRETPTTCDNKRETGKNDKEESPEVELGEQQRMGTIEAEKATKI